MKRSSLTWGGVLILLGALFLLDNLDIININIWGLFWPLLLIWIGVQILLRPKWGRGSAVAEHVTIPLKGSAEAHVRVNYGAGELHIHGHTAPDELLDGGFGTGLDYTVRETGQGVDVRMRPPSGSSLVALVGSRREPLLVLRFERNHPLVAGCQHRGQPVGAQPGGPQPD